MHCAMREEAVMPVMQINLAAGGGNPLLEGDADAVQAGQADAVLPQDKTTTLAEQRAALFQAFFGTPEAMQERWAQVALWRQLDTVIIGSNGWSPTRAADGPVIIRPCNVGNNALIMDGVLHVRPPSAALRRMCVTPGDVLVGMRASGKRAAAAPAGFGSGVIGTGVAILRSAQFAPEFLAACLCAGNGARGTAQRHPCLTIGVIRTMDIPLPPLALQRMFAQASLALAQAACPAGCNL